VIASSTCVLSDMFCDKVYILFILSSYIDTALWLGDVVVSMSDSRSRDPRFNSRPVDRQATTLGKLLTPMCLCHQAVQFGTSQRAGKVTVGLASHWPCGTDFSGLSTYGLTAKVREMSTPPTSIWAWSALPFFTTGRGGGDQDKQMLQNVKVKRSTYSRWKPVTLESIKIAMNALAAAVGFVDPAFQLYSLCQPRHTSNLLKIFSVYVSE